MRILRTICTVAVVGFAGIAVGAEPPLGSAESAPSPERPFGWRGDGTGRFPGAKPPTIWSDTKNVRWSAVVGSAYSSPILTDQLVIVASEPNQLTAINRTDGKLRWQIEIKPADLADEKSRTAAGEYVPPKDGAGRMSATPLTDGKTVYAALANGIVCAVGLDGKRKWTAFIDAEQSTGYGRSASPLLVGGKLIVHMTNLYAFDPANGKQSWVNSDAPSKYGTPTALKVAGVDLIVTPSGDAVRAADGKTVASDLGISEHTSPVAIDSVVYLGEAVISALRFDAKFKANEAWSGTIGNEVIGSPLVHEGILFTATGKGELFAFDAKGKGDQRPLFEARPLFGKAEGSVPLVYASITLAGKHLFLNSNQGEIVVLEATREAKLVARNRLGTGTGSSPIFSGQEMFLRDGNKLFCINGR
jgi:outer membrane protein assembly factor BamB